MVAGGTAAGQALTMVASPVLTRLFRPEDMGILAAYTSATGIAGAVCSLSYHAAIPLPEDDPTAANILGLSLLSAAASSVIALILCVLFGSSMAARLGAPDLAPYMLLVPLAVFGLGSYEILSQWAVRKKNFAGIAKTSVARAVAQVGMQLTAGAMQAGPLGLLVGQLAGQWTGLIRLWRDAWVVDKQMLRSVRVTTLKEAAWRYRRFPAFVLPAYVFNAISSNAPPILLLYFFGGATTGMWALGLRAIGLPFSLVGAAAEKVFYVSAVEARREGHLAETTCSVFDGLLAIALPVTLLLAIAAPEMFAVIFGARWRMAGVYMQWMCLRTGFTLVVFPLMPLTQLLERQHASTLFQGVLLVARVGTLTIGGLLRSAMLAVALEGAVVGTAWLGLLIYLLAISGNRLGRTLSIFGRKLAQAVGLMLPLLVVKFAGAGDLATTGAATLTGLAVLATILRSGSLGKVGVTKGAGAGA